MKYSLIVAASENNVIGSEGGLPWKLSGDLKLLKSITMGHVLVMGRKTFESIGRALPGRVNIVLTRGSFENNEESSLYFVNNDEQLKEIIEQYPEKEVFIFGGESIYKKFLRKVDRIYLTRVHANINGDTYFPSINWNDWNILKENKFFQDEKNNYDWSFQVLEKKS